MHYCGTGCAHAPENYCRVLCMYSNENLTNDSIQVAYPVLSSKIYMRKYGNPGIWTEWIIFSDDATVLGQTITYSSHTIPANGTMTIEEGGNTFYQLVILRGTMASGYNAILLTGYSPGTNTRYFYKVLDNGDAVDISISNTSFVMTNKSSNNALNARIFRLYGNAPTVSVS